jgi:hypothetical protein
MSKIRIILWVVGLLASLGGVGAFWVQNQRIESAQRQVDAANQEIGALKLTVTGLTQRVDNLNSRAETDSEVVSMGPTKRREELSLWATE